MKEFAKYSSIKTERLILRLINAQDVDITYLLRSNPIVGKYILRPLCKDRVEAKAHVDKVINLMQSNESIIWVIEFEKSIGTICLWNFSKDRKTAEIGYDLLPEYYNKGIMTEALKTVLHFGFNTLKLKTIEAFTHKENSNSIKLLKRQGLVFQENRRDPGFPHNAIFSITKKPL